MGPNNTVSWCPSSKQQASDTVIIYKMNKLLFPTFAFSLPKMDLFLKWLHLLSGNVCMIQVC